MDNFCLYAGWGIRAGYPSAKLLRSLSRAAGAGINGRVILLLTANPYYALDRVRPGARLTNEVARHLRIGKVVHIGANDWYVQPGGVADGIVKVRHGIVQEVGIASGQLLRGRAAQMLFLTSFSAAKP
jgi:hypothetical protein